MYPATTRVEPSVPPRARVQLLEAIANEGMPVAREWILHRLRIAGDNTSTPRAVAEAVLRHVQDDVRYIPDPVALEIFNSVPQTLLMGGDCEDLATLFVSAYRSLGGRTRIVWITQAGKRLNHVTAQVSFDPWTVPDDQATWLWAEASVRGAAVGENPYDAAARLQDYQAVSPGTPTSYSIVTSTTDPAGMIVHPAGAITQTQLDDIIRVIRTTAQNDDQQRLEGLLNSAAIGAARAAGAQASAALQVIVPEALSGANTIAQTSINTAFDRLGSGPEIMQALGASLGQSAVAEINRELHRVTEALPTITANLSTSVENALTNAGGSAEQIGVATSNALLGAAVLFSGAILFSVAGGVALGATVGRRRGKAA